MVISACEGSQKLAQRVTEAFVANALYDADQVGRFLHALRRRPPPSKQQALNSLPEAELAALVKEAHEKICPYSHATRGNVNVAVEVVGG